MVGYFATNTAPTGWLKANGAAVSRTVYSTLFGRVGTTFGAGNGTNTFNLPDLRGEFIRAWDDGRGADPSRIFGSAASGGSQVANHSHTYDKITNLVTRYINDLGAGNGDPVIFGTQASAGTGSPSPLGEETAPRNVALLACIKY
jgi:phage-related tail fiber protein